MAVLRYYHHALFLIFSASNFLFISVSAYQVTDVRLIRQRIEDINDLKSMTQEIDELADEIAHIMQQNKKENDRAYGYSSRTTRPQPTPTPTYKPPVDLWGESPRSSSPPRTATRPPPPPPRAAPPRSATPTPTTAPTRTARKEPDTRDVGRNNVKGMDDYLDYNFDEETLDNFGGEEEDDEKESTKSPWRKQYESRRNPNGSGQAFASFLFEDEEPQVVDEEEEEEEDGQNRAVLNELLRLFKMSKKPKK